VGEFVEGAGCSFGIVGTVVNVLLTNQSACADVCTVLVPLEYVIPWTVLYSDDAYCTRVFVLRTSSLYATLCALVQSKCFCDETNVECRPRGNFNISKPRQFNSQGGVS